MNSLLKRQIRKFLPKDLTSRDDLDPFLKSICRSYTNYEEQTKMIQHAVLLSSDELLEVNKKLQKETDNQQKVINKLNKVVNSLQLFNVSKSVHKLDLDALKLAEFINGQTNKIVEMNRQRDLLLQNLKKQNEDLNNYANMVSHDLKAPLRNIDTLALWLKEDIKKPEQENDRTINLIRNNVESMEKLINGILAYSSLDNEEVELYDINLNNLVNEVLAMIHIPNHIQVKFKNRLPTIKGDKYRFIQLFQNLIDNAIIYNDKEKGLVEISCSEDEDYWNFCVRDNGKGIADAYLDKIFGIFKKLDNNLNSPGIGLSIVKKIVTIYHGRIYAKSKLGIGTEMFFNLKKL